MKLEDGRKMIDAIDTEILVLLNRRAQISRRIGSLKCQAGLPIVDRDREQNLIGRILRENEGDIGERALVGIYREILRESRRIQTVVAAEAARSVEQCQ